jgi:TetR/AcrR family transcriptional regulator of autoinduction and epiphytic fitness
VLEAAHRLFLSEGYGATTLKRIAEAAGVSLPSVYAVFGSKRKLLLAVFDQARHSRSATAPDLEEPLGADLRPEAIARRVRLTREGGAPVARMIANAAASDRALASMWRRNQADRHRRMRDLAAALTTAGRLHDGVDSDEVADILWALTSNEVYGLLVLDRGWTPDRYERWLATMLGAAVVAEAPDPESG